MGFSLHADAQTKTGVGGSGGGGHGEKYRVERACVLLVCVGLSRRQSEE